jgi:hypothetical protein
MNQGEQSISRFEVRVILVLFGGAWVLFAFRWLPLFYACIYALNVIFIPLKWRPLAFRFCCIGFVVLALLPVDISFKTRAGPPKFLPVIYGYPTKTSREKAARGEAVLGGCLIRGYDPLWVLVW